MHSPRITIEEVVNQAELQTTPVEMTFRVDGVSQEANETFTLSFTAEPGALEPRSTLRDSMQGTVVDATGVTFQLSQAEYKEVEGKNAVMPVVISKSSYNTIANPIEFMVIPLTVDMALTQQVIPFFEPDNFFSPNRADFNDFNNSVIRAIFPADEGQDLIVDLNVPIPIFDDDVNEAHSQFFIAYLVVDIATNKDLIRIELPASNCTIIDNDVTQIGFELEQYDYFEPDFSQTLVDNVTLIKEGNRVSEQIFGVQITFSETGQDINPAILQEPGDIFGPDGQAVGFDYVTNHPGSTIISLIFGSLQNATTIAFTLFPDTLSEGTEGFQIAVQSIGSPFPTFQLPSPATPRPMPLAFPKALIRILDTDFAVVGFERDNYTVAETDESVEICVLIFNPPANETLASDINLEATTREGTAGNLDFHPIVAPFTHPVTFSRSSGSGRVHRECIQIVLRTDQTNEDTECFFVDLALGADVTDVIVDPPVTKVFILDNEGTGLISTEVVIGFINLPYNAFENDAITTVEFGIISGKIAANRNVSVELFLSDQTAFGGSDYQTISPQVFTFNSSITSYRFNFAVINDIVSEAVENLQACLRFVGSVRPPNVTLQPTKANITILDDDVADITQNAYCFTEPKCGGSANIGTEENCCRHGVAPFGVSFAIIGTQGCFPCPVEFGFVESAFTAEERVIPYTEVQLAFFSGQGTLGAFRVFITYTAGTATENSDVHIISTGITINEVAEQAALQTTPVEMIFRLDGIAQEANETFTLGFTTERGALGPSPTLRDSMLGTVVDANSVTFQFSQAKYREPEGENAMMPVIISKASDVFIANPVEFMVFPITVDMALAQHIISEFELQNFFSSNRADFNDFNNSVIHALFPADEGQPPQINLNVPVNIFDDDVDEADEQFFITHLVLTNATNKDLINIERAASCCTIVDNDPIRIGFELNQYDYFEPQTSQIFIQNITLLREDNRVSEQTFGAQMIFGDPGQGINPAILQQPGDVISPDGQAHGFDYLISTPGKNVISLSFPPQVDRVTFTFSLFPDALAEGTEGIQVRIIGSVFADFQLPSPATIPRPMAPAFPVTLIRILDTDCPDAPRSVTSFCTVVVWQAPFRVCGLISGYRLRLFSSNSGRNFDDIEEGQVVLITKNRDEFFHRISAQDLPTGNGEIFVQVQGTTDFTEGIWSEPVSLDCIQPSPPVCPSPAGK